MVTASGLIFISAATYNLIRAIDIATGRIIWQDVLAAGGQATPMVYEVDGRQYLVITAGGHHFMETSSGDYVIVYALPGTDWSRRPSRAWRIGAQQGRTDQRGAAIASARPLTADWHSAPGRGDGSPHPA